MAIHKKFAKPTVLTPTTKFLGATVEMWDQAFTGNFEKVLIEVKRRAIAVKQAKHAKSRER
jgi:hypothetical protein